MSGGLAAVALLPVAVVLSRAEGLTSSRLDLSGGSAWLASPAQGVITLIDGASEQVVGLVPAPGGKLDPGLSVVQSGTSAFVVQPAAGTVARIDGRTYETTRPVAFAEPGGLSGVLAGGDGLYVVDGGRRTASVADPQTLAVRQRLSLAAQPGPGQSVVDSRGRLWVIDAAAGGLTWFDPTGKHVRTELGDPTSRLVLVGGAAVLVDRSRGRLGRLADDGSVPRWSCFDVRAADSVEVLGSARQQQVWAAVSATGTLVAAGVGVDDCTLSVEVGDRGDTFGPLVESGDFVLVPNRSSGRTLVIDTASRQVVADLAVVKPGARLELLAKDDLVFYNDLDGERAGVIRFDGKRWILGKQLQKFNPRNKGEGVLTPGGRAPQQEQPKQPAQPDRPPAGPSGSTAPGVPPEQQLPAPGNQLPAGQPPPAGTVPSSPVDTAGPPPPPPQRPPVIRGVTVLPRVVVRGQPATFTADVVNGEGGTWHWVVVAGGVQLGEAVTADSATITLPETAPADAELRLDVRNEAGAAPTSVLPFSTTTSRAPQIDSITPSDADASLSQPLEVVAVERSAGPGAIWTWKVSNTGTGAVLQTTTQPEDSPLEQLYDTAGSYRVELTVEFEGATDTAATTITVGDRCRIEGRPVEPLDLRPSTGGREGRGVGFVDCFQGAPSIVLTTVPYVALSTSAFSYDQTTGTGGRSGQFRVTDPADVPAGVADGGIVNDAIIYRHNVPGGAAVSFSAQVNKAPDVFASACETPQPGDPDIQMRLSVRDADEASLTATISYGTTTHQLQLLSDDADGATYGITLPVDQWPQGVRFTGTAVDPFGLEGTFSGSCSNG